MVWNLSPNADCSFKNEFIELFVIIFGTLSFRVGRGVWERRATDFVRSYCLQWSATVSNTGPLLAFAVFCHSDLLISELVDRADRELFKLIQLSHYCLNALLPSSRLPYSRYSLWPIGHQFRLPQLNTALYKLIEIRSLNDVCPSRPIFSCVICLHYVVSLT